MVARQPKTMKPLFLASNSPRRATVLSQLGLEFTVLKPFYKEIILESGSDDEIVNITGQNALQKALSVRSIINHGLIISGDTLVVTDQNKILGKPKTPDEAFQMLHQLVGRTHRVISAVAIVDVVTEKSKTDYVWTKVTFHSLSDADLHQYLRTEESLGKAGGYAIQGKGRLLVKSIEGSYTAVVGLPIEVVVSLLRHFGIQLNISSLTNNQEQS
ncbi:MAG: Maf family protein [Candidatus Thorarchaeota archaeon]